jgi:hypothetical protein
MMFPVQPMEVRVVYDFEQKRTNPVSEHRFWLRVEQQRRRAARLAALRARVVEPLAPLRQMLSTGVSWERQMVANECGQ